jgi:hypothetical protein
MSASAPNAASRSGKVVGRPSLSGDLNGMRKSAGAAVAAWLKTTYRRVIEQNPLPALGFTACFLETMLGILFLIT